MIRMNTRALVEFGNGTVILSPRLSAEGYGLLGMDICKPHEIGQIVKSDKEPDINEYPVILAFKNIESLDVLIEDLNIIRKYMGMYNNGEFEELVK